MYKIFIDCGYHLGEGLREFTEKLKIDDKWIVYAFEANPNCEGHLKIQQHPFPVIFKNQAVWVHEGTVTFNCEDQRRNTSPTQHSTKYNDGWGSCVGDLNMSDRFIDEQASVSCVDFSRFVAELPEDSEVYCKMDIEGSEFPVLRKMLKDGTIARVKEWWVEFHDTNLANESLQTRRELMLQMSRHSIVHEHH